MKAKWRCSRLRASCVVLSRCTIKAEVFVLAKKARDTWLLDVSSKGARELVCRLLFLFFHLITLIKGEKCGGTPCAHCVALAWWELQLRPRLPVPQKSLFKAATNPSNLHLDIIWGVTDVISVDALEEKPLIHFDCPPERVLVFLSRYWKYLCFLISGCSGHLIAFGHCPTYFLLS